MFHQYIKAKRITPIECLELKEKNENLPLHVSDGGIFYSHLPYDTLH